MALMRNTAAQIKPNPLTPGDVFRQSVKQRFTKYQRGGKEKANQQTDKITVKKRCYSAKPTQHTCSTVHF